MKKPIEIIDVTKKGRNLNKKSLEIVDLSKESSNRFAGKK